jgi:hypothetical protein
MVNKIMQLLCHLKLKILIYFERVSIMLFFKIVKEEHSNILEEYIDFYFNGFWEYLEQNCFGG